MFGFLFAAAAAVLVVLAAAYGPKVVASYFLKRVVPAEVKTVEAVDPAVAQAVKAVEAPAKDAASEGVK